MYLIPNLTLILMQLLPFLITLLGMYFIIFKPMLQYLDDREDEIKGSQKHALELAEEAKNKGLEAQKDLQEARKRASIIRQEANSQAMQEYSEQIAKARREAYTEIQAAEKEIKQSSQVARESLQQKANDIASEISSRILGRQVS